MKEFQRTILSFVLLFFFNTIFTQDQAHPTFTPFEGTVYKIPARQISKGYTKAVYDYEQIAQISLKELDIPDQTDDNMIEGIPINRGFGIIFKSEMTIPKDGEYLFSLNSDDGSILWINEKGTLYNGKLHEMTLVQDSVRLEKGKYPIKIWYYQGVANRYGLEFKARFLKALPASLDTVQSITLSSEVLNFETNSSQLTALGKEVLSKLAEQLRSQSIHKIHIIGHTDDQGSLMYNQQLSEQRATSVKTVLQTHLSNKNIQYITLGKGETLPIDTNTTAEGRAENRRVELQIE